MTYSGSVAPGGPSAVRELDAVIVRKASVGSMDNNAYLLTCRETGAQLLVDAAAEPQRLLELVREGSPHGRLDVIVTTHQHRDHHGALAAVVAATGARTVAGRADADGIPVETDEPVDHGALVQFGAVTLEVIGLRGHTPGSIALVLTEPDSVSAQDAVVGRTHLFTGDSLFPGGVGNTDRDPTRFAQLYADVTSRLFDRFRDDTWVYPGHGADTTLGAERPQLPTWRERGW
ncbi:MAG: MBL fold metallo-hydrolase [Actinomycetales bacterium]|nr:MBL fold metallo-hydrolase [Actinomycetales bacterium]